MHSPDGNQPWCPSQSLWSLIAEHVSGSELQKIRTALGHSLVDMYTDVYAEAEMLGEMCQVSRGGGNHGSRGGSPFPCPQGSPLADPPAVKELLRAEVKMLLQTLRERASRNDELLFRYKPETVNYALSHSEICYSNRSNPDQTVTGSRPGSHCSVQSSAEDEIEAMREKLNVSEIDQVVDHLRSLLKEEWEALTRHVKYLKGNIKHKRRSHRESDKCEPSLAELRELRENIQLDLELYPSSLAALTSLPAKDLKHNFRPSAGQSAETLPALTAPSALRPHPRPPLGQPKPRPPGGRPLAKTSLSRPHSQHRVTSSSDKSSKTPTCNNTDTSGHANSLFTSDQILAKSEHHYSSAPQQDRAVHNRMAPSSFQTKSERNAPVHKTHLSSHRSIHRPSINCHLSPQSEGKSSAAWRPRNINITPSPVPAPSHVSDVDGNSSISEDRCASTKEKSSRENGKQDRSCRDSLESPERDDDRRTLKTSVTSENRSPPGQNDRKKSNREINRNKNAPSVKDDNKQQSLSSLSLTDGSIHHPESSDAPRESACTQPSSTLIEEQFFTYSKKPHGGSTGIKNVHTGPQFLERVHQPVPPATVPT
ncbi:coiled-coil domain-containing protein 24 [Mugil cephalus]|uniref:coiled-coil domain-containing protein 24 n=1 Tax=Mugil cephalus TaxID=48193 RepID=UPI001FB7F1D3|nr:coiled-coil domain-containing protein 24 [Mugil cephalus]